MDAEKKCLALRMPGRPDAGEIRAAVDRAVAAPEDWGALEVEIFPGREGTLLLVRPAAGTYIREDALRFLAVRRRRDGEGNEE